MTRPRFFLLPVLLLALAACDRRPPATPQSLQAQRIGQQVRLTWSPNAERDLAGYHVQRDDGGGFRRITAAPLAAPSFLDGPLVAGWPYRYTVTALDRSGNESRPSSSASLPLPAPIPVPAPSTGPAPSPGPVPSPIPAPVPSTGTSPIPIPAPSPSTGTAPSPIPTPVPSTGTVPAPVPAPTPSTGTVPVPSPSTGPAPSPSPVPAPSPSTGTVPSPVPPGLSGRPFLLVDDDGGGPEDLAYEQALDRLFPGKSDKWSVDRLGPPAFRDLLSYKVVLWITGEKHLPAVRPEEKQQLRAYLDQGGSLLVASRRLLDGDYQEEVDLRGRRRLDAFAADHLGILPPFPPVDPESLEGRGGEPVFGPAAFDLVNRLLPIADHKAYYLVRTSGPSEGLLEEATGRFPGYFIAVKKDAAGPYPHRLLYWGFGLEDALRAQDRESLLNRAVSWLDRASPLRWSSPAPGRNDFPVDGRAVIGFRVALDPASVPGNVRWLDAQDQAVPFAWSYSAGARALRLTPASPLSPNASYRIILSTGLRDVYGDPVSLPPLAFRTAAGPAAAPPSAPAPARAETLGSGGGRIFLSWPPPAEASPALLFRRQAGQSAWQRVTPEDWSGAVYIDTPVPDEIPFEYALAVEDAAGRQSPLSAPSPAYSPDRTPPVLSLSTPVTAGLFRTRGDRVTLAGTVDDPSARVFLDARDAAMSGFQWSLPDVPLPFEGTHLLDVTAEDPAGNRDSVSLEVERDESAMKPERLRVVPAAADRNLLEWDPSGERDLVAVEIHRRSAPLGFYSLVASTAGSSLSYADALPAGGGSYCYKVRTRDDLGNESDFSDAVCPTGFGGGLAGFPGGSSRPGGGGTAETPVVGTSLSPPAVIVDSTGPVGVRYFLYSSRVHPERAVELEEDFLIPHIFNPQGWGRQVRVDMELPNGFEFDLSQALSGYPGAVGFNVIEAVGTYPHPNFNSNPHPWPWDPVGNHWMLDAEQFTLHEATASRLSFTFLSNRRNVGTDPQNPVWVMSDVKVLWLAHNRWISFVRRLDVERVDGRAPRMRVTVNGQLYEVNLGFTLDPDPHRRPSLMRPADDYDGQVNLASGGYFFDIPLFEGAGHGINISGRLGYSSIRASWDKAAREQLRPERFSYAPFGPGWSHPYGMRLILRDATRWDRGRPSVHPTDLIFVDSRGGVAEWRHTSIHGIHGVNPPANHPITIDGVQYPGYYNTTVQSPLPGFVEPVIAIDPAGGYTLLEQHPERHGYSRLRFDDQGRLTAVVPHGGATPLTVRYQGNQQIVRDSSGREAVYHTGAGDKITQIDDPAGGTWRMDYSGDALVKVEETHSGYKWEFAYDAASHLLIERKLPDGSVIQAEYDTTPGGPDRFFWGALKSTRWKEFPAESLRTLSYEWHPPVPGTLLRGGRVSLRLPSGRNTLYHDVLAGKVELRDHEEGFPARERLWSKEESDHPFFMTAEEDADGRRRETWVSDGVLTNVKYEDRSEFQSVPNPGHTNHAPQRELMARAGDAFAHDDYRFEYHDPSGPAERLKATYPPGQLPSAPNALKVLYEYDAQNRIDAVTDTAGSVTRFVYHSTPNAGLAFMEIPCQGRPLPGTHVRSTTPYSWQRSYDGLGRLVEEKDPEDFATHYVYDEAGRLKELRGPAHPAHTLHVPVVTLEYDGDLVSRRTEKVSDTETRVETYVYDQRGRLTERRGPGVEPDGTPQVWRYDYDRHSNLEKVRTPAGKEVRYEHDNRDRLVRQTGFGGEALEFDYDASDRVTAVRLVARGGTRRWSITERDPLGRPVEVELPEVLQDGVRGKPVVRAEYDGSGNVVKETYKFNGREFTTRYGYGPLGELRRLGVEMGGNQEFYISHEADEQGRVIRVIGPRLASTPNPGVPRVRPQPNRRFPMEARYSYDCFDGVESMKDRSGDERFRMSSDRRGIPSAVSSPDMSVVHRGTNPATADTLARGMTLDAMGLASRVYDAGGQGADVERDGLGRAVEVTDAGGVHRRAEFDREGKLLSAALGDHPAARFAHDEEGRPSEVRAPGAAAPGATFRYNDAGQVTHVTDAQGRVRETKYNGFGEVEEVVEPDGARVQFDRDGLGRVTEERDYSPQGALARTERRSYDALGRLSVVDDDEYRMEYEQDPLGRLLRKTVSFKRTGLSKEMTYRWGEFGNMVEMSETGGGRTEYDWDDEDNLRKITHHPVGGPPVEVTFDHDGTGRLTSWEYKNGGQSALAARVERDQEAHMTRLSYSGGTSGLLDQEFSYDARDLRSSVTHHHRGLTVDYEHDDRGFLVGETVRSMGSGEVVSEDRLSYDAAGNRLRRRRDGRVTAYSNNVSMELEREDRTSLVCYSGPSLQISADSVFGPGYEAAWALDRKSPDGVDPRQGWRSADAPGDHWLLLELGSTRPVSAVEVSVPTERGGLDRMLVQVASPLTGDFRTVLPNLIYQGARRAPDGVTTRQHTMRLVFTTPLRTSRIRFLIPEGGAGVDPATMQPRRDVIVNEVCLLEVRREDVRRRYDLVGRLVSDGTFTYGYDVRGRLADLQGPGVHRTYSYTPEGLKGTEIDRVANKTTHFLSNGTEAYSEFVDDGAGFRLARGHLSGPGADLSLGVVEYSTVPAAAPEVRFLVKDGQAGVAQTVGGDGRLLDDRLTNAWGEDILPPTRATDLPLGFAGRPSDAAGLVDLRARMYDPSIGRFISKDPSGLQADLNPYAYAGNSPATYYDPSGEFLQIIAGALIGGGLDLAVQAYMVHTGRQKQVNWGSVAVSAALGAASGGLSAFARTTATSVARGVAVSNTTRVLAIGARGTLLAETAVTAYGLVQVVGGLLSGGGDPGSDGAAPTAGPQWGSEEDMDFVFDQLRSAGGTFNLDSIGQNHSSILHRIDVPDQLCFLAGTWVAVPGGLRPIEDVRPGDQVIARDEATGRQEPKTVAALVRNKTEEVVDVSLESSGAPRGPPLRCTPGHPFYIRDKGWRLAGDLKAGDELVGSSGEKVLVRSVVRKSETAPTYNFEVEGWPNYFAAPAADAPAVWVHNFSIPARRLLLQLWRRTAAMDGREMARYARRHNLLNDPKNMQRGALAWRGYKPVLEGNARDAIFKNMVENAKKAGRLSRFVKISPTGKIGRAGQKMPDIYYTKRAGPDPGFEKGMPWMDITTSARPGRRWWSESPGKHIKKYGRGRFMLLEYVPEFRP